LSTLPVAFGGRAGLPRAPARSLAGGGSTPNSFAIVGVRPACLRTVLSSSSPGSAGVPAGVTSRRTGE
jgi:hypothetical protein